VVSIRVAQAAPGFSYLTDSTFDGVVGLAASWGLVAVGLETRRRARRRRLGTLLSIAGIAWLLPDWADPAIGSAVGFSLGVGLGWVYPAVVAHALLAATADGAGRHGGSVLLVAGYSLLLGGLGILPALAFDPQAGGCTFCPPNLLHVLGPTPIVDPAVRVVTGIAAAWAGVVSVALLLRVARAGGATRRRRGLIALPGIAFFVIVGAALLRDAAVVVPPTDVVDHRLRAAQAVALAGLSITVASEWLLARRARARAAQLVADLAASPPIGALRGHLATVLGDTGLRLVYPSTGGTFVDAAGRTVTLDPQPGRTTTPVLRGGSVVAAARLGLEHERLQAELRAQLDALRTARRRIVDAADAQRKRLERDLHDGAQQHLIALSIAVRLLERDVATSSLLEAAASELHRALDDLREIAHGIYPAVLDDEGLAAAIEAVAEGSAVPLSIGELDDARCPSSVEIAAYQLVVAAVRSATGAVDVRVSRVAERLQVEVALPAIEDDVVQDIADRVGAVDGTLTVTRTAVRTTVVAGLPCAS